MAQQARFKSEVFVPIHKDDKSFEERQKSIWDEIHHDLERDFKPITVTSSNPGMMGFNSPASGGIWNDMHSKMDQRRREWESEVERMRSDFFKLKPSPGPNLMPTGSPIHPTEEPMVKMNPSDLYVEDGKDGSRNFRVSFDVSQFTPEEISVRTQDQKLVVHAKHEESKDGKNVSREFSRQIDIPKDVEPEKLQSTLSKDGILQVEAPVPAPSYEKVCQSQCAPNQMAAPTSVSSLSSMPPPPSSPRTGFRTGPVLTEQDGTKKLKMTVEIGNEFKPEEIMVKTVDRKLQISAKHEEKTAGRSTMREFSKELELPENVDPNCVSASMTEEGKLIIEAPLSSYNQGAYQGAAGSKKEPEVFLSLH